MIDAQWPPNAFNPVVDSEEPTIFPLRYLEEVALQFAGEPLQIAKFNKGIFEAGNALRLSLMICVKGYTMTYLDGIDEQDWTLKESDNDCYQRVSKIENATCMGSFQGDDFEALFTSQGVVGLGPTTQDQRTKYASGQLKLAFRKFFPSEVHELIVSLVEPKFSMFLGTPINQLISHNEGERPEVFAARIDSLWDALQRYLVDAEIVTTLMRRSETVFSVAGGFGFRESFDMSGQPFYGSFPCGARGAETSTFFGGVRSDEPLVFPRDLGYSLIDRFIQEHHDELPEQVFDDK
jgi:hypothetical protein